MQDLKYMGMALELAEKGRGHVNPNPMVGAVIVKDGEIIGSGYHQKYGGLHAERNALAACTASPKGAVLYVTLEPCCHYGKTPPCTEAILQSGIARVVVGSLDPNPLVAGKGIAFLREHGIQVETGILKEECDRLNRVFFHYIQTHTPYVVMKYAMTLDGKLATRTGKSKWITGEEARTHVHQSRSYYSGIMVGVGTVLADDPMLTCRLPQGKNPIRIICDTHLRTPLTAQVVATAKQVPTILATGTNQGWEPYQQAGCQLLLIPEKDGGLDLTQLMKQLGEKGIDSILLEGGSALQESALREGLVQWVQAYIAPKIFGGQQAKSPVGGLGVESPEQAYSLINAEILCLGEDLLLEGEVKNHVYRDC